MEEISLHVMFFKVCLLRGVESRNIYSDCTGEVLEILQNNVMIEVVPPDLLSVQIFLSPLS